VGVKTPEWELEEHRLFGPWIVKVLVERQPAEGWGCVKWYQSPRILSVYCRREERRRKGKHSDTHDLRQVVSELVVEVLFVWITGRSIFKNAAKERATVT
jgi:hypothetical protein